MKKFYLTKTLIAFILFTIYQKAICQTIIPGGNPARFGIDGDLMTDTFAFGTAMPAPAGSDDWFKKPGGSGLQMIDTTGAANVKSILQTGNDV